MKIFLKPFLIACFIYAAHSGGDTFMEPSILHHRYISFSPDCMNVSQYARDEAQKTAKNLNELVNKFDRGVLANGKDYSAGVLESFVTSYLHTEEAIIDEIISIFNIEIKDFKRIIRSFGVGATGDLLCAYEVFGEAVGDNIDFYQFAVQTLRHDIIGYPSGAEKCPENVDSIAAAVEAVNKIRIAYENVKNSISETEYDHFQTAYTFVEAFEQAMAALSDNLEEIYALEADLWMDTLLYDGQHAPGNYLCAYGIYYQAEHKYIETYFALIMDIIQKTNNHRWVGDIFRR